MAGCSAVPSFAARNLLSRPPHRGRSERGSAPGSEGVWPGQTMKDLPEHLQHESFRRRAFRRVMDGTPVERRGGAPSGLKRLFADEPSLTITSAATREFVHPTEDRLLTLRECARLQTFPDSFVFAGSAASRIQQIGNAIPPMLARTVAEQTPSLPDADPRSDRPRCGGRESKFLADTTAPRAP